MEEKGVPSDEAGAASEECLKEKISTTTGERLAQEKQLAALSEMHDEIEGPGTQMSETQRAALMNSLARKEEETAKAPVNGVHPVDATAVRQLQELLLLPAVAAEAALQHEGGDVQKAVKYLMMVEEED